MSVGGHQQAYGGKTDEWLTPPGILEALGPFDLDPCSPVNRPWDTALRHYTMHDNGLNQPWEGRVWLNPPYGPKTGKWLARMVEHRNGIALIFARTETQMFFGHVWNGANAVLFLKGRLHFHRPDGTRAKANSGGPSVLIAYGTRNAKKLLNCGLQGRFIDLHR